MDTPSPHSRSSSSPSPPPQDDAIDAMMATASQTFEAATLSGPSLGAGKRRYGGMGGMGPKSRRRDDFGMGGLASMGLSGSGGAMRRGGMGGGPKEEVVDAQLVEQLRIDFGDPFDDRKMISS